MAQGIGLDDDDFPPPISDEMATGYGNQPAGQAFRPQLPETLAVVNDEAGPARYPEAANRRPASGEPWTGTVTM